MGRLIFSETFTQASLDLLLPKEGEPVTLIAEKTSPRAILEILPDNMIEQIIVHADKIIRPGLQSWLCNVFDEDIAGRSGEPIALNEDDILILVKLTSPLTSGTKNGYNQLYAQGNILFYVFHICLTEEHYAIPKNS